MNKINADWHLKNKMPARIASQSVAGGPKNPTLEQRIAWHREHAKNCACHPIPPKLLEKMKKS